MRKYLIDFYSFNNLAMLLMKYNATKKEKEKKKNQLCKVFVEFPSNT